MIFLEYYLIRNFSHMCHPTSTYFCRNFSHMCNPTSTYFHVRLPWHEPANNVPFYMVFFEIFQESCHGPSLLLCVLSYGSLSYFRCMIKFDDLTLKFDDLSHKFGSLGDKYINAQTFYMKRNNYASSKSSLSHTDCQA